MKIGLDIHGVIDLYPDRFRYLSHRLVSQGHEVHIITGQEWDKAKKTVEDNGITYTHHFSIVDHHRAHGTEMWQDGKGTWWMDNTTWVSSKGLYIHANTIDIHFDDSHEYGEYVPDTCTFILVPKTNFQKMFDLADMM